MPTEYNVFYNTLILVPAVTFMLSVIIKGLVVKYATGIWDIERAVGSGGMPSVHSSVVVSLATAFALKYGIHSDFFAIVMGFTVIIIYDAINVRFEAGLHAKFINESLGEKLIPEKKLKESLGHLPSEAFAGSMLGVIVAIILFYI
ncbi:divergent PAP2 family protein [Candidatus Gracilibacteria bacterium]|nr:divergent PAP2 family protein [Candidatus Gracilibacteria bacterium]